MRLSLASIDRPFYSSLLRLAVPIATQSLVMNALNAVDVLLIGQLGETSVAAVGLSNQIYFLLNIFLFGVGSGSAIFSAQFWGRQDLGNLRRVVALALLLGITGSLIFGGVAILAPQWALGRYTSDPDVIALGAPFLRRAGFAYLPTAISALFGMLLRSTRQVKVPVLVSIFALSFKTLLAYVLIFGKFGAPQMGIMGAVTATVIARCIECGLILYLTYSRDLPVAVRVSSFTALDRTLVGRFARTTAPVVLGEILWSFGITTYNAIYGHISTESLAAVNITSTIESVALVPIIGLGNACAIMLGNRIGEGDERDAMLYAKRFIWLTLIGGVLLGGVLFVSTTGVTTLYKISAESQAYARVILGIVSAGLWLKAANVVMIVGILRSGGDTRYQMLADVGPLWIIGVPLGLLGAFVLKLPVYIVVLMVLTDEVAKFFLCIRRVRSGKWVHNVVHAF